MPTPGHSSLPHCCGSSQARFTHSDRQRFCSRRPAAFIISRERLGFFLPSASFSSSSSSLFSDSVREKCC
jgi:hypothetical protein